MASNTSNTSGVADASDAADAAVNIGEKVQATRKQYRLTQVQLAELAQLSDKTVRDIERGTGSPSLRSVLAVLHVLGLSLEVVG